MMHLRTRRGRDVVLSSFEDVPRMMAQTEMKTETSMNSFAEEGPRLLGIATGGQVPASSSEAQGGGCGPAPSPHVRSQAWQARRVAKLQLMEHLRPV